VTFRDGSGPLKATLTEAGLIVMALDFLDVWTIETDPGALALAVAEAAQEVQP
jgi:hypothetical protein